ncbi:MAG: hypothetical protein H6852_09650 [Geminicoccaceae bacterium]|jgi:hypothetical protein|nr:hypothetical protein [Geminicoccaceae bacterium]MCB9967883.1 hypothetical protein [Geminicoccaceae bacterium]HRY26439.1 hypothetical protein [Geminicoccaceae bacterium]
MLAALPLLVFVVGVYHLIVLFGIAGLGGIASVVLSLPLVSGATLELTMGDLLVLAGLVLLYIEIFKATRTSTASIVDHLLSMALFVVCLVEVIVLPGFGTATFVILTLMTAIDVVAGFTVTISGARRDIGLEDGIRR